MASVYLHGNLGCDLPRAKQTDAPMGVSRLARKTAELFRAS